MEYKEFLRCKKTGDKYLHGSKKRNKGREG